MSPLLLSMLIQPALAGYGDADDDGHPSWSERTVHMYTNMVRIDPPAFEDEFNAGGCGVNNFSAGEADPKAPLWLDENLNIVARVHSQDMSDNNWFDHDSSDGTDFFTRVSQYYDESGYVGENIAMGYTEWTAVMQGWMCSSGHRANIQGDYNELGVGVVGSYFTQDFAAGTVSTTSPVAMGTHEPQAPSTGESVLFYADWATTGAPAGFSVVIDGDAVPLELTYGTEDQGVYTATVDLEDTDEDGCWQYWYAWEDAAGVTGAFPEEGSYVFGTTCASETGWVAEQQGGGSAFGGGGDLDIKDLEDEIKLVGCSSAPARGGLAGLALVAVGTVLVGGRRRRA